MENGKLRKSNTQNKIQVNTNLQPLELSIAKVILIRDNQQTFKNEIQFNILKRELNIVSKNNILKCEGRLKNAIDNAKMQSKMQKCNRALALECFVYKNS